MKQENIIKAFWNRFLIESKKSFNTRYISVDHFELTEKLANELLRLVLIGQKKATASAFISYQILEERVPQNGDLSIITDWNGIPRCVIETTKVIILPYKMVSFEIASKEGEDQNLESWREGHSRFFIAQGKELGYEFSDDLEVLFEEFKVVYQE